MLIFKTCLCFVVLILPLDGKSSGEYFPHLDNQPCPGNCFCDIDLNSLNCTFTMEDQNQLQTYLTAHHVSVFSIHKSISSLYVLRNLQGVYVNTLNLSINSLRVISVSEVLSLKFPNVETLDLSQNFIDSIEASAFNKISYMLKVLNLSSNMLSSIPADAFRNLQHLQFLSLRNNQFESLPSNIFQDLSKLKTLDLSFNKIHHLSSKHFAKLSSLQTLYLHNNLFRTFHADVIPSLSMIPSIDISFNPFECSCAIRPLIEMVKTPSSVKFLSSDDTTCLSPEIYQGRLLQDVPVDNLNCSHPVIANISSDQSVLYYTELTLSCDVVGYPDPSVIWFTPWGDVFSHHSYHHLLGDQAIHHSVKYLYLGQKLFVTTEVSALSNGSLHIDNMRGFFAGNFTCLALTPVGNDTASTMVHIYVPLKKVYIESLIYGGISAAGFLGFGIIVAIIITIIRRVCCTDFFKVEEKVKIPDIIIVPASDEECSVGSSDKDLDDDDFYHPPESPISVIINDNNSYNSEKHSPSQNSPPHGWLSTNMIETIGEVRSKLRYGVERKMETVRCHTKAIKDSGAKKIETVRTTVKTIKDTGEKKMETIRTNVRSIKDSSTVYMQNIKDTGSSAAHRVRAGVVMSVESVKYTVQSMKELCGTGEMGTQTISMISMETDIDSHESKEVLKTVTFV